MSTLDRLTRLVHYLKPYQVRLGAAFVCSGMVAAFSGAYAWLIKPVLDEIFINKNESLRSFSRSPSSLSRCARASSITAKTIS